MKAVGIVFLVAVLANVCLAQDEANKTVFTALEMNKLTRLSGSVPSPDGKNVVYVLRDWDQETGKVYTHLEYIDVASKATGVLTKKVDGKDSSPAFSDAFGNTVFFLSRRSGSSQIWTLTLPDNPSPNPPVATQLTNYPVDIQSFKIRGSTIALAIEVYSSCGDDLSCTATKDEEVKQRGANTYQTYDKLLMRHWDKWLSDKVSHIYVQKLTSDTIEENGREFKVPKLKGNPLDLMLKMETNSPVGPFGGTEMYSIAPDESEVVFTGFDRTREEAWTTGWKIYVSKVQDTSVTPEHLSSKFQARTTQPQYSPDGKYITFLAMTRVNYESDNLHLELYNRETKESTNVSKDFKYSIIDYVFSSEDPNLVYVTATELGVNKIFPITLNQSRKTTLTFLEELSFADIKPIQQNNEDIIYSSTILKHLANSDSYILERNSFQDPTDVWIYDSGAKQYNQLTKINPKIHDNFELTSPASFSFPGGNGDSVQGWIINPINFDAKKKYPLAFLIHGGPESSWTSGFSYGWNPQLWANNGYVVVMINPHGSVGQGQAFTDLVINDWGGLPYKDLMLGLDYVISKYPYVDGNRACAVGGSYGGYMVNWIQGQTDRFKCLVNHDGAFSTNAKAYSTDELWFPLAEHCPLGKPGCLPWDPEVRENYWKFSPESYVHNWKTPHLIIQGSRDFRIPVSEATSAFTALQVKGIPSRFLHFTEENHWVLKAENSIKWYQEVLGWLDRFTKPKSP